MPNVLLVLTLSAVTLFVLIGFRRRGETQGLRMSVSHLEADRDRLVRALARMRRAMEKGQMSASRYEREQEAVTARLVSIYRAIDQIRAS